MAITPPVVVPAPEPRGLRYGLLSAANGPLPLPPHGAAGGVIFEPVSCGIARIYDTECHCAPKVFDEGDNCADERDTDCEGWVRANPFIAYSSLQCGTAGSTSASLEAKVRRRLANGEQTVAEEGLALVLAAGATALAPADATLPGVVADLEQWLYGTAPGDDPTIPDVNYGNIGYLHAPVRLAAYAAGQDLIVRDGPLLRTPFGTIWVFGGGYPDNGLVFISGQVTVWRSDDVFVSPPQLEQATNQYYLLAEREYAVAYDCVAASAVFDWTPQS